MADRTTMKVVKQFIASFQPETSIVLPDQSKVLHARIMGFSLALDVMIDIDIVTTSIRQIRTVRNNIMLDEGIDAKQYLCTALDEAGYPIHIFILD